MKSIVRQLFALTPYELRRRSRPSDWLTTFSCVLAAASEPDRTDLTKFLNALCLVLNRGLAPEGQLLQDVFALSRNEADGGLYVDCGAGHPRRLSNTVLLQYGFKWQGLLIEPNPKFGALLQGRVTDGALLSIRAAGAAGDIEFVCHGELSGATDRLRSDWAARDRRRAVRAQHLIRVQREPLGEILLREIGPPREVSYLNVDVEGGELDVISSLDWKQWRFLAVTVEHNFVPGVEHELTRAMAERGYRRVLSNLTSFDAWFVPID